LQTGLQPKERRARSQIKSHLRPSTSSVQKMLELIDHKILIADYAFYQITNRDDSHQLTINDNGKMAHSLIRHNRHAFCHRLLGSRKEDCRLHNIQDAGGGRYRSESNMPDILSFCNDAFECLSLHHDQAADIFLRHLAYGIVYGVRRTYRKNLVAFSRSNCLIVVTGS